VLAEIKAGPPPLRHIPVVILTTSCAEEGVQKCYDLHGNCYITRPVELERCVQIMKSIGDFWLSLVTLPPEVRSTHDHRTCQHSPGGR